MSHQTGTTPSPASAGRDTTAERASRRIVGAGRTPEPEREGPAWSPAWFLALQRRVGQEQPIVLPWEYLNYSATGFISLSDVVYGGRDQALAAAHEVTAAGMTTIAYYHAAAGFLAPTFFSPGTTPRLGERPAPAGGAPGTQ